MSATLRTVAMHATIPDDDPELLELTRALLRQGLERRAFLAAVELVGSPRLTILPNTRAGSLILITERHGYDLPGHTVRALWRRLVHRRHAP